MRRSLPGGTLGASAGDATLGLVEASVCAVPSRTWGALTAQGPVPAWVMRFRDWENPVIPERATRACTFERYRLPGVLALGVHTGGVLGKLFGEVLEDVDTQPIELLQATGANRLQILFYGILPQVLPQFISYTLYRWEVNIRVAAVLGLVGAGGLGQRIHIAISLFFENQLLTLIMAIYVMVTVVDYLSAYLRRKVV